MAEADDRSGAPHPQVRAAASQSPQPDRHPAAPRHLKAREPPKEPGPSPYEAETANQTLDSASARAYDLPQGEYLLLSVSDTGAGMPPDVIARVFEPFFTTKPIGQGIGLGLSMIYGFAQQSGGQVRIHSQGHEGDVVRDEHRGGQTNAAFAQNGETIPVVDDEATIRMLVTDILSGFGYPSSMSADTRATTKPISAVDCPSSRAG